jgi:hypothetical protein
MRPVPYAASAGCCILRLKHVSMIHSLTLRCGLGLVTGTVDAHHRPCFSWWAVCLASAPPWLRLPLAPPFLYDLRLAAASLLRVPGSGLTRHPFLR